MFLNKNTYLQTRSSYIFCCYCSLEHKPEFHNISWARSSLRSVGLIDYRAHLWTVSRKSNSVLPTTQKKKEENEKNEMKPNQTKWNRFLAITLSNLVVCTQVVRAYRWALASVLIERRQTTSVDLSHLHNFSYRSSKIWGERPSGFNAISQNRVLIRTAKPRESNLQLEGEEPSLARPSYAPVDFARVSISN